MPTQERHCKILNFIRQPRTGTSAQISQFERFSFGGSFLLFARLFALPARSKQLVQLFN